MKAMSVGTREAGSWASGLGFGGQAAGKLHRDPLVTWMGPGARSW